MFRIEELIRFSTVKSRKIISFNSGVQLENTKELACTVNVPKETPNKVAVDYIMSAVVLLSSRNWKISSQEKLNTGILFARLFTEVDENSYGFISNIIVEIVEACIEEFNYMESISEEAIKLLEGLTLELEVYEFDKELMEEEK